MSEEAKERRVNQGTVYFLDYDTSVLKPIIKCGCLWDVKADQNEMTITVEVYHDERYKFNYKDNHVLFFEDCKEAEALLAKLPEKGQKVYCLKKSNDMVTEEKCDGYALPYMLLKSGEKRKIADAGITFFLDKEDACKAMMKA